MKFQVDERAIPRTVHHAPAGNTDAVCTIAAAVDEFWVIKRIIFSYDAAPAAGSAIVISYGGAEVVRYYVTASGPGELQPDEFCNVDLATGTFGHKLNQACEVRLLAAGGVIKGALTVIFK